MQLTESDRVEIKYQLRAGVVIASILFFTSLLIMIFYYVKDLPSIFFSSIDIIEWIALSLAGALLTFLLINRKYLEDLRCGEKDTVVSVIERKTKKTDFEAGSGCVGSAGVRMKEFIRYDIIIDNTIYRVDEKFYNECAEGDRIILYFARHSRYHLGFELKK